MTSEELERNIRLLSAHRSIEQQIYRMGYALEDGDFELVGELLQHATFGADMIGRRVFTGRDEIRGQYERTNIVYPGKGRATREMYTNVVIDIDLDAGTARSTTMYTVAQQIPDSGDPFALLVAGRYEDEWAVIDGEWQWTDRFIVVQFKNDLNHHMHTGSQPYN
ncbi:MAG TPA: nuclear transport factor 2 family protein [Acidimicrobiales bacterium]|nr:nuclear transport factor 2 family protein [Acidimicrobiales bacterium]